MSNTESSEGATLSSDSSLETMLSAAVVAREVTTSDSSDVSDSIQEALAADYEDSSGSEFTVENTTVTVHANAPDSIPTAAGGDRVSEGVSTGGALPPPPEAFGVLRRNYWPRAWHKPGQDREDRAGRPQRFPALRTGCWKCCVRTRSDVKRTGNGGFKMRHAGIDGRKNNNYSDFEKMQSSAGQ